MPTNAQIDAPQTLTGLFPPDSDEELDDNEGIDGTEDLTSCCYEIQSVVIAGETLQVRQYDYHSHNANRVWPGTFNLADYLLEKTNNKEGNESPTSSCFRYQWGNILELGTATGLLAIRLCSSSRIHTTAGKTNNDGNDPKAPSNDCCCCEAIVTSDVQDEHDDIQNNLVHNYELNNILNPPIHVPHTWGTGWQSSVDATMNTLSNNEQNNGNTVARQIPQYFDTVIASDILLYVSAYGALVQTLLELFMLNSGTKFVMSWNRRMKESSEFFDRMADAGFTWKHEGKCIFTFELSSRSNELIP